MEDMNCITYKELKNKAEKKDLKGESLQTNPRIEAQKKEDTLHKWTKKSGKC